MNATAWVKKKSTLIFDAAHFNEDSIPQMELLWRAPPGNIVNNIHDYPEAKELVYKEEIVQDLP